MLARGTGKIYSDETGKVHFPMRNGEKTVHCSVTIEALQDLDPEHRTAGPNELFEMHRAEVEAAAIRKFNNGQVTKDGKVLVTSNNLVG